MHKAIYSEAFSFFSVFIVARWGAQQFPLNAKTGVDDGISFKVKPGMFGLTLGYLDDNW